MNGNCLDNDGSDLGLTRRRSDSPVNVCPQIRRVTFKRLVAYLLDPWFTVPLPAAD
jgi:hypothetical protein